MFPLWKFGNKYSHITKNALQQCFLQDFICIFVARNPCYLLQLNLLECQSWFSGLLTKIGWLGKWPILQYRFAFGAEQDWRESIRRYINLTRYCWMQACGTEKVQWMQTIHLLQWSYRTIYTIEAFAQRHFFITLFSIDSAIDWESFPKKTIRYQLF